MIEWIVSSSVLICVVLVVRALCRGRLSCRARYCLWLLVLARLLVPVQLFTTSWGVSAPPVPEVVVAHRNDAGLQLAPAEADPSLPPAEQAIQQRQNQIEYESALREARERRGTPVTLAEVLRVLWLAGAVGLAAVLLASNLRFARRLRRVRVPCEGHARVYIAAGLASPCLVGMFRPTVYLTPECTRNERTLCHVLAHERTHQRHGDGVWSLLRLSALCLHWYNPLVWLAVVASKRDGELACDEATLERLGESERVAYGETLLSMVRARPGARELLSLSTSMTAGKKPMRERIETLARHPRTRLAALLLALAVLVSATVLAFSRAAEKETVHVQSAEETEKITASQGRFRSAEDYLDEVRAGMTTVTCCDANGGEKTANVLDTRVAFLEKDGELSGLAPDGTLELYRYGIETKLDVPLTEVALVGGMYATEDGWCDPEGQGGHSLILLRRADGGVDALFDRPNNDDRGGLYYYEESAEEMLYDYYVRANDLDLPLYTKDLALGGENRVPAHRRDVDGWYLYVPIQAWTEASSGGTARWISAYGTGSSISVREASREEMRAERPQLAPGQAERFVEAADGRIWLVWTQYDPAIAIRSDMAGLEPAVLEAMAASFTVTGAEPDAAMRWETFQGDGWTISKPTDWTYWETSGLDPEEVAENLTFRASGSGDWQGEGLMVTRKRHSAAAELDDCALRGMTVDRDRQTAESETLHTRCYDLTDGECCVVTWQDPTGFYGEVLRAMAASFRLTTVPVSDEPAFFAAITGNYWFLSGAGGWHTELNVKSDGTFTGFYRDFDVNTVYYNDFSGRFERVVKVNDFTYSMRLRELSAEPNEGEEHVESTGRWIGALPYGIENTDELLVFMPGAPVDELPEDFVQWYAAGLSDGRAQIGDKLPTVGLYCVDQGYGWFAWELIAPLVHEQQPTPAPAPATKSNPAPVPELSANDGSMVVVIDLNDYEGGEP